MSRILKKSWHEAFFECVSPHTDAPDNFITWAAISLIGATLKNNVHFEIGTYILYPNQFIVLVAPPGVGKGTAMNIIGDLNDDTKLGAVGKIVNTLSDRITAEKIIECIADGWNTAPTIKNMQLIFGSKDHTCLLFSEELRVLLGASEWMLTFLEVAWSQKRFEYQTKNKGSVFIDDMCCSLLAASVPDFLRNVNKEASMVISGGFSSRCLFIYAESPSKNLPWPEPLKKNSRSKALYDNLLLDLKEISRLSGEFTVAADARVILEKFLDQNKILAKEDSMEAIVNFRARIKAHVLKLAMVFSVSSRDSLVINGIDMTNAIIEVNKVIGNLERLFRGAGDSLDASITARVLDFIEKKGRTTKREIHRNLYRHVGSSENLDRILFTLENIQFVVKSSQSKMEYYQPAVKKVGP